MVDTHDDKTQGFFPRVIAAATRKALTLKIVRSFLLYSERRGPMLADSVTYRALFSVFAALLLGFSITALWLAGNDAAWDAIVATVSSAVPGLIGEDGVVDPDDLRAPVGLTLAGIASLIALIGAALGAIGSLRAAIRTLADTTESDVFWVWVILRNFALALAVGVGFVVAGFLTYFGGLAAEWASGLFNLASDSPIAFWTVRLLSLLVIFALDAALIVAAFLMLSGLRPSARSLWTGALLGAAGLLVLQELSGLFVGGASNNPLLATFASLLALLIWLNLSLQVVLIASAYIVTGVDEEHDRVRARYGATTFAQRRVQRAERAVSVATRALNAAREAERGEKTSA